MEFEHRGDFLLRRRHALAMAARDMMSVSRGLIHRIVEQRKSLERNEAPRLKMLVSGFLDKTRDNLSRRQEILELRSPRELLKKGYAFISSKGAHLSSVDQVSPNDELLIHLSDGRLQSTVTGKHKDPQD